MFRGVSDACFRIHICNIFGLSFLELRRSDGIEVDLLFITRQLIFSIDISRPGFYRLRNRCLRLIRIKYMVDKRKPRLFCLGFADQLRFAAGE